MTKICYIMCTMVYSQMAIHNHYISLRMILTCPAGSRAWRLSFASVVCGPDMLISLSFIFSSEFLSMSCFFSSHSPHVDLVMQIAQHALYQPIRLGCLDRKWCGQIRNTMDITSYPQSSLQR